MNAAETMSSDTSAKRPGKAIATVTIAVLVLAVVGCGLGIYYWEHGKLTNLEKQEAGLNAQLASVKQQEATLQADRTISTNGWKSFCDTNNKYCFQYPSDWKVTNSGNDRIDATTSIAGFHATNASGNINLQYQSHYFKDGIGVTFHVVSIDDLGDPNLGLKVVGGYFVSENRQPFYVVVDNTLIQYFGDPLKVGQDTIWANTPRFEVKDSRGLSQDAIYFDANAYNQTFPSTQSADAWFHSVNGLTSLSIMKSLHKQS
jgi:hypothetical protein